MERLTTTVKKQKMLTSLVVTRGNVTTAAERACIGKTQFYYWLKNDDAFKTQYLAVINKIITYLKNKRLQQLIAEQPDAMVKHVKFLNKKTVLK